MHSLASIMITTTVAKWHLRGLHREDEDLTLFVCGRAGSSGGYRDFSVLHGPFKMILVVNMELNMGKGR